MASVLSSTAAHLQLLQPLCALRPVQLDDIGQELVAARLEFGELRCDGTRAEACGEVCVARHTTRVRGSLVASATCEKKGHEGQAAAEWPLARWPRPCSSAAGPLIAVSLFPS